VPLAVAILTGGHQLSALWLDLYLRGEAGRAVVVMISKRERVCVSMASCSTPSPAAATVESKAIDHRPQVPRVTSPEGRSNYLVLSS
jgi:hypothetical protein